MREAISNAMVFNLVLTFVIILLAFFIGSLSYSKAYKVKNRIVEVIEKEGEYNISATNEINDWLAKGSENGQGIGYRMNTAGGLKNRCADISKELPSSATATNVTATNDYEYCVYEIKDCDANKNRCDTYYRVVTYMYFDVPIVSDLIRIPVTGETMTFTELNS